MAETSDRELTWYYYGCLRDNASMEIYCDNKKERIYWREYVTIKEMEEECAVTENCFITENDCI